MEQSPSVNVNNDQKKASISETEVYFNNLLRSQEEDTSLNRIKRMKYLALLILAIIVGTGFYLAAGLYINSTNIPSENLSTEGTEGTGAYFNPSYYTDKDRRITGTVEKASRQTDNEMQQFELLENNGKTIAYLFSRNHDLNLSVGLQVEIQGQLVNNAADGKEIIEVQSIKLK